VSVGLGGFDAQDLGSEWSARAMIGGGRTHRMAPRRVAMDDPAPRIIR
jgi:hypothetical protein